MFQSLRKLSKPVKANWQVKFKRLTLKTLALQFIYSISLVTALLMAFGLFAWFYFRRPSIGVPAVTTAALLLVVEAFAATLFLRLSDQ
jgi:hypothetical protein